MAISISKYVDITSGIGAASNVGTRSLGGLFITENALVPTGHVLEFTSAADVGDYFGTTSTEYLRAVFYFGWRSKQITTPRRMSFYYWPEAAVGSKIFGKPATYALGSFTGITTGDFTLTLGGFTHHLTAIDLSAAGSLGAVAAAIQVAVRAFAGGGVAWTGATVSFDATRGCFNLVSGTTGDDTIAVAVGVTTDLAAPLGWLTGAILSNGAGAETITENLNNLIAITNNFGSFAYIPAISQDSMVSAATWNNSLSPNMQFIFSARCTSATAAALSAALLDIGGVTLTLAPLSNEYPEQAPMMILAATDYAARNSTENYEFQIFNLTASVNSNADKALYDGLRVNYYGQTQTAGQLLQFYQEGLMMGLPVDPSDQNVYANEIWFKDALGAALMNLLLALSKVSANATGRSQVLAVLSSEIQTALFNGTISVGKALNVDQKLFISQATGDPKAWYQVQSIGYWVDAAVESYVESGVTKFKIVYTLIYSKDDTIRKIEGRDILI